MPIYSTRINRNTVLAILCRLWVLMPANMAHAQSDASVAGARGGMTAGGELDNYLRYLQTMGRIPLRPWSLRTFSAPEVDSLTNVKGAHPWGGSWLFKRPAAPRYFAVLPLTATAGFNSAFPFGGNDGAVWAGRGLTTSLQGGVALAWGPVSAVLDPLVFRAENSSFTLQPNGQTGVRGFADGDFPQLVDRPQRFGDGPYSRFDFGQSTVRVDWFGLTAGISTANQYWGPATVFPVILGNNAAGVPHVFFGTERPTNIGVGRVQARVVYGLEHQSDFSPVVGSDTFTDADHPGKVRFMSGLVVTFTPATIPGLELGGARYFHQAWTGHVGANELRTPFEGLLKSSISPGFTIPGIDNRDVLRNQLASVFGRWVLPRSGFEVYGEYGHEDHNYDIYDFQEEPDHSRIAMAGLRKVFQRGEKRFSAFRAEFIDGSESTLGRHRGEGSTYVHYLLRQGHTEDGQLLGADIGVGSPVGANLAWESFSLSGRTTWYVQRVAQNNERTFMQAGIANNSASHLFGTVGYERHRFGRIADIIYGAALTEAKRGASLSRETNVTFRLGTTVHPSLGIKPATRSDEPH